MSEPRNAARDRSAADRAHVLGRADAVGRVEVEHRIGERGGRPGIALDEDLDPGGFELGEGFRHERDAALAGQGFSRNADFHVGSWVRGIGYRIPCASRGREHADEGFRSAGRRDQAIAIATPSPSNAAIARR